MSKANVLNISSFEHEYLNKWLLRYGKVKVRKYQAAPELILNDYYEHIKLNGKSWPVNDDQKRLAVILRYIDFVINIERDYKIFLKQHGLKGWHVGQLLGYRNSKTWHKSYKRYTYIRFLMTMIQRHETYLKSLQ